MPFPGVPVGSDLEKKIDRCVEAVTATGRDKSTAIAICRSSIEGKGADGPPSSIYAHGPGGLLSVAGLGRKKKETSYQPPAAAQANARRVLRWREQHGDRVRGMTPVGWARARQLASGAKISLETVKRMAKFNRHRKNATVAAQHRDEPWRDAGHVAWLGWGGDAGVDWAIRESGQETTKEHTGAMVSLTIPADIAQQFALGDVEGALPASELHVTLAFLGKAADLSEAQVRNLHSVLQGVAQSYKPLQAAINGVARFCNNDPDGDAFFIIPDIPDLPHLRQDLVERLAAKNIPYSTDHGFVPHITLAYIPHDTENPFSQIERVEGVVFPSINLTLAGERYEYPFLVETTKDRRDAIDQARYRDAGPASTQVCETCKFTDGGNCTLFDFRYDPTWTCDRWLPNIEATRARLRALQQENKARMMNRKEMISTAKQILTLKREIAASVRRDLPRADFVFPDTRSFPIQRPEDVHAAVSSWGRASNVRAQGHTFEDFKRRLTAMAKRKGAAFVAALPAEWKSEQTKETKIGTLLRRLREQKEMSIADVAARMPIDASTIGSIERGDIETPSVPVMRAFAKVFGVSFDRLRSQLPGDAMPLERIAKDKSSFSVFKDHTGRYRWLMISSSAYEDRDREIVSQKALASAVAEHDAAGERGPLRWWHLPIDIGDTDFGMMSGKMLIESGTFKSERIGGAIAAHVDALGASIGFTHPKNEPKAGAFENIKIFERSLLPKDKASNYFVKLTVKEFEMNDEKVKEFINLVGPELAAQFLSSVSTTDKGAEDAGFRYKETADLAQMSADELLEYSLLRKEHEEAEAAKQAQAEAAKAAKADDGDDDKRDDGGVMGRLNRLSAMVEKNVAAIKAMNDRYDAERKQSRKEVATEFDQRLAALEAEQPRALAEGYRATQGTDNIVTDKKEVEQNPVDVATKEALERAPQAEPFMSAATSMVNGMINHPKGHPYYGAPPTTGPTK